MVKLPLDEDLIWALTTKHELMEKHELACEVVEAARLALRALDSKEPKKYGRGFSSGKIEYAGDVLEEALKRYDEEKP